MWGKPVLNNVVVQIETEKPYQVKLFADILLFYHMHNVGELLFYHKRGQGKTSERKYTTET